MSDILIFAGIFVGWIVLNLWVLPLFGIQTCLSGACRTAPVEQGEAHGTTNKSPEMGETVHQGECE